MKNNLHSFVICAYKENPFLEECIKSVLNQTIKSEVMITTSTPNDFVKKLAKKYNIKLIINKEPSNHIKDFCFAYKQAKTKYVTLCHQDDIYFNDFAEKIVNGMEKSERPIIAFSNYYELKNDNIIKRNLLLIVKRIINFPLKFFKRSKKARLISLSLGNAICSPSVTYNKEVLDIPLIESEFKSDIDWISYVEFAKENGSFIYVSKPLIAHRIHEESTTSKVIADKTKNHEDYIMFRKFWPNFMAKILTRIYSTSEKSNNVKERKNNKMKYLLVLIYLILTVSGLILYKYGANKNFEVSFVNNVFNVKLNILSILGLACYIFSFLIYMLVLPKFDLSYIMPLTSAVSYICVFIFSGLLLKEAITTQGIIGVFIIIIGLIIMNIR